MPDLKPLTREEVEQIMTSLESMHPPLNTFTTRRLCTDWLRMEAEARLDENAMDQAKCDAEVALMLSAQSVPDRIGANALMDRIKRKLQGRLYARKETR